MSTYYILRDSFNGRTLSKHRTLAAAVKAQRDYSRRLSKRSPGSYLTYQILVVENGATTPADHEEIMAEMQALDCR